MAPGPTGPAARVLQVHPTLRCNLRCLHCYSSSGPERTEGLDLDLLARAVGSAADEGYNTLGVSGGEPLLYPSLPPLLEAAHACGMRTTVTSNGMLLTPTRVATLRSRVDLLAISLDGVPGSHDRMRDRRGAFESMSRCLVNVREAGIPFGFIFTLTQRNLDELEWVATFAQEAGARLLQIHPLEEVGRAREKLPGAAPDARESTFAYVVASRLQQELAGDLVVQLDLADGEALLASPERVFADEPTFAAEARLADLLSPLVIETDGTVVPLQWGFPRVFALGNLHDAPLAALGRRWRTERCEAFRSLCRSVFERKATKGGPFFNWYETVSSAAGHVEAATAASTSEPSSERQSGSA